MNVTDPLEDHRKHLYSFYLACNILNESSKPNGNDESYEDTNIDERDSFLPFLNFEDRLDSQSDQEYCDKSNRSSVAGNANNVANCNSFSSESNQNADLSINTPEDYHDDCSDSNTRVKEELNSSGLQISDETEAKIKTERESSQIFTEEPSSDKFDPEFSADSTSPQEATAVDLLHYTCFYCNKRLRFKRNLRKHVAQCFQQKISSAATTRDEQRTWKKSSRGDKTCKICGHVARKPCELKMHIAAKHTGERPFSCRECGIGFTSTSKLNRHIKNKVHAKGKFYCELCKIYFSVEINYERHKLEHTLPIDKTKPFVCCLCEKRFNRVDILRKHIDVHTRDEKSLYQCITCKRTFSRKDTLVQHISREACR